MNEFNRDIKICRVLSEYSRFSSDEIHMYYVKYESFDGIIQAIEFADRFNRSLEYACQNVIPIKEKQK